MGPLAGTKVIDLTSVIMGPCATQALGDMGADVIKIESPEGDVTRQIAPFRSEGMGAIYLHANRSKRSLCLDLKNPEGHAALIRLIRDADILVYNLRPQAMTRLGLDYETLAAINPGLIYAGLYGFRQDGPYGPRPAYDDLIQGASVMSHLIARSGDGIPRYVPSALADRVVGLTAVGHICATLVHRNRTGIGQRLDIPMFETMTAFVLADHFSGLSFDPAIGGGGYGRQLSPGRRPYPTADGYVCALVYSDKQWTSFLREIGQSDLPEKDPRFATFVSRTTNIDHVYAVLGRIFETRTTAEWLELLDRADVPAMPMHDFDSVLVDPHLEATGFFRAVEHPTEGALRMLDVPSRWSQTPLDLDRLPPHQGEQGIAILREAGFAEAEIEALRAAGALLVPEQAAPQLAQAD